MKTSYLVRKNNWMDDTERNVARRIAREAEKALDMTVWRGDAVSAVVFYCAGCAVALLGRVQARYSAALMAGDDVAPLQAAMITAEQGVLRAMKAVDALVNARLWRNTEAWDAYSTTGSALRETGAAMQDLALEEEAALAVRHAAHAEASTEQPEHLQAGAATPALYGAAEAPPMPINLAAMEDLKARFAAIAAKVAAEETAAATQPTPPAQEENSSEAAPPYVPRWLRRQREQEAAREARRQARQAARAAAR